MKFAVSEVPESSAPSFAPVTAQSAVSTPVSETIRESFCVVPPPSRFIVAAVNVAWISRLSAPSMVASSTSTDISICPPPALISAATTTLPIALIVTAPPLVLIAPRFALPEVSPLAPAFIVTPPPPVVIDEPALNVTSPAPPDPSPAVSVRVLVLVIRVPLKSTVAEAPRESPTVIVSVAWISILVSPSAWRRPTDNVLSVVSGSLNAS